MMLSNLLFASSGSGVFPQLFELTSIPLLKDHKFKHSCGNPLSSSRRDVGGQVNNYFFFSLTHYLVDENKKQEYRFFENKDFIGEPAYILNKEGLKQRDKIICSWGMGYDEQLLYENSLANCTYHVTPYTFSNIVYFLYDYDVNDKFHYYGDLCSVVKVSDYLIEGNSYYYQVSINNELFYLDTSDMPDLANGKKFYSYDKRLNYSLEQRTSEIENLIKIFSDYRSSSHYSKIKTCFINKDVDCVSNVWSSEFFESVATAGYDHICDNNKGCEVKGIPLCGKDFKDFRVEINSVIFSIIKDVLEDITFMRTDNYHVRDKKIFYRVPNPHREMRDPEIILKLDGNEFKLIYYDDGLSC